MRYRNKIFQENGIGGEDFESCEFKNCKFININIRFTSFAASKFVNCDFGESSFDAVNFTNCEFIESKLSYIDFSSISLKNCKFDSCQMLDCIFQRYKSASGGERKRLNLKSFVFEKCGLAGSAFVFCDLTDASFEGSKLNGVVFEKCDLTAVSFIGADIEGAGFENCKISKTKLDMDGFLKFGASKGFVLET
jgi:fluoroquinolone resistance protein